MLLDAQGVILATSSGTMNRDLTNGTDYGRALTSANGIGSAIFTTPQGERVMAITMLVPTRRQHRRHADGHKPDSR